MIERFCNGEMTKIEKLHVLKNFFVMGNANTPSMIKDKKSTLRWIMPDLSLHCSIYLALGFGYGYVMNIFYKVPRAYYFMPIACVLGFGYYKYYELITEKARMVDKYEYEMFKYFCKKKSFNKNLNS